MVYTDYMGWTGPWSTSGDASKSDGWVTSAMRTCSRRCTTETAPAGPSSIVYQFYCTGGYWISTFPVCEPVSLHLPCNVQTIKKKDDRVFFIYNTSTRAVVIFASCRSNGIGLYNNTISGCQGSFFVTTIQNLFLWRRFRLVRQLNSWVLATRA